MGRMCGNFVQVGDGGAVVRGVSGKVLLGVKEQDPAGGRRGGVCEGGGQAAVGSECAGSE
jgi:hypothetical protein